MFVETIVCDCQQTTVKSSTLPDGWYQISVTEGSTAIVNGGQYCSKEHAIAAATAAVNGTT